MRLAPLPYATGAVHFMFLPIAGLRLAVVLVAVSAHAQAPPLLDQQSGQPVTLNVESLFATSCGWCHQGGPGCRTRTEARRHRQVR